MTPADIFHREITSIYHRYAGLLDGDHDSIHRARIATRRVREILPLTHEWQHHDRAEELRVIFKRMGRTLGRVRDADTRVALVRYLEARIPHAAPSLVLLRSVFISLLDAAERAIPTLTPQALLDRSPMMHPIP